MAYRDRKELKKMYGEPDCPASALHWIVAIIHDWLINDTIEAIRVILTGTQGLIGSNRSPLEGKIKEVLEYLDLRGKGDNGHT